MNKKTIITGVVIAGIVIIGAIYLNNRKKIAKQKAMEEERKKQEVAKADNEITESDAIEILNIIEKKEGGASPLEYVKTFIPLYLSNIDKNTHEKIKSIMMKNEKDWTTQERLTVSILSDKVIQPSKNAIGELRKDKKVKNVSVTTR